MIDRRARIYGLFSLRRLAIFSFSVFSPLLSLVLLLLFFMLAAAAVTLLLHPSLLTSLAPSFIRFSLSLSLFSLLALTAATSIRSSDGEMGRSQTPSELKIGTVFVPSGGGTSRSLNDVDTYAHARTYRRRGRSVEDSEQIPMETDHSVI